MKFLLVDVQGSFGFVSRKKAFRLSVISPPLGLLYIGRSLEDEGHEVEILEYFANKFPEQKLMKSLASADAVGFGVYSESYKETAQAIKTIKESDPSIPVIIGGPHCTFHQKKSFLDVPMADINVDGDAEYTIKDIAKVIEGTKKISEVPGVFYRENDKIKPGKPPEIIQDLDSIPFPARHLVDKYDYGKMSGIHFYKPPFTSMVTSRGCPFHCRFCARHALTYKTFRQRSAENVVKEIQEIDDKYNSVIIVDDNFLVDKKRAHKITDNLIELGTNLEIAILGARVDSAERDLYKKMKKAGVTHIYYGIESGNQDVLDFYRKGITLNQIRKAVDLSNEMNFVTSGCFILGASIETERHIEQTIKFACSLPLDFAIFSPLFYAYGSDLWIEAVQNGNITENERIEVSADSRLGLGNFTVEELQEFWKKATARFYLRPNYVTRQIFKAIRNKNFNIIRIGLKNL